MAGGGSQPGGGGRSRWERRRPQAEQEGDPSWVGGRQKEKEAQFRIVGRKTMNNFLVEVEEGDLTIHFPSSRWEQIDCSKKQIKLTGP